MISVIANPGSSRDYKTGRWRSGERPLWNKEKCRHCAICFHFCPEEAVGFKREKMVGIDYDYCKGCGICALECPFSAIRMIAE